LRSPDPAARRASPPRAYAVLTGLIGLTLASGGGWLLALGGSPYYAACGLVLLACAVLLWRGMRAGAWLYGLMLAATLAWSLWEVGLDGWALMPRLVGPAVFGLWLLTPWVRRGLD